MKIKTAITDPVGADAINKAPSILGTNTYHGKLKSLKNQATIGKPIAQIAKLTSHMMTMALPIERRTRLIFGDTLLSYNFESDKQCSVINRPRLADPRSSSLRGKNIQTLLPIASREVKGDDNKKKQAPDWGLRHRTNHGINAF